MAGGPPEKADTSAQLPAPVGGQFTRAYDGWSIDKNWLAQIARNTDKVLTVEGYLPDLELYDSLLDDDVTFSAFQQRRLDVVSRDWEVEPGGSDAKSVAAADHLRDQLKRISWDAVCDKMLYARWYGYGVAEPIYEIGPDGLLRMQRIYVPNRAWFCFNNAGELLLRTPDNPNGESVPAMKFWELKCGGSHDDQHYGLGLAHWCYWPIYFKKNAIKFWALFLEKFGMPTVVGKFPPGWEQDPKKVNDLLVSIQAIGTDSAVTIPATAEIDAFEGQRSGSGASSYNEFIDVMDTALTRVILTQTMTSEAGAAGLGSKQAEVHETKGLAVAQSDSDLLHESFNNGPAKWLTEWNFPGAIPPRVYRKLTDDEDLDTIAERDTKLDALGWRRTDESMKEVYGEGYERKPDPQPLPIPGAIPGKGMLPQEAQRLKAANEFAAHDPKSLYIQRKLLNADELLRWARAQGFTDLKPADDLHVTVLYCEKEVDWFKLAEESFWLNDSIMVEKGGPRVAEPLGPNGVIVLHFASRELQYAHENLIAAGATHGHPTYWPHVTFANSAAGVDLDKVEPYRGKLQFGPEIWAENKSQPALPGELLLDVPAVSFASDQLDAIDRLVIAMSADGQRALSAMIAPVREAVAGLAPDAAPDALRVALLQALEAMDASQFAAVLADPLVAVHAAAAAGIETEEIA